MLAKEIATAIKLQTAYATTTNEILGIKRFEKKPSSACTEGKAS
jgi:hypothetical protein